MFHHPGILSLRSSLPPLPDYLASLDIGMKHLLWRGVMYTIARINYLTCKLFLGRVTKTPLLDRRGGANEAAPKVQTNECRGGGWFKAYQVSC